MVFNETSGVTDNSVKTSHIQDEAITNAKISATAAIAKSKLDATTAYPAGDANALTNLNAGNSNIFLSSYSYHAIVQGTWAINSLGVNVWNGGVTLFNSSNTLNDEITFKAHMNAGTYSFKSVVQKAAGRGIAELFIDGVSKGTYDAYSAANNFNQLWSITGIVVAATGIKTISIKITSKNAGSAGYWFDLQQLEFFRTA